MKYSNRAVIAAGFIAIVLVQAFGAVSNLITRRSGKTAVQMLAEHGDTDHAPRPS